MKIHLINPAMPLSFLSNEYGAPMVLRKYSTPPLGLLTAAGMIPTHHQVTLCDENTSAMSAYMFAILPFTNGSIRFGLER